MQDRCIEVWIIDLALYLDILSLGEGKDDTLSDRMSWLEAHM